MIGDGEAETGPLAASWHSNKWVEPAATEPSCRSCQDDVRDADADAVLTHGQTSVLVVRAREDRIIADEVAEWLQAQ